MHYQNQVIQLEDKKIAQANIQGLSISARYESVFHSTLRLYKVSFFSYYIQVKSMDSCQLNCYYCSFKIVQI